MLNRDFITGFFIGMIFYAMMENLFLLALKYL